MTSKETLLPFTVTDHRYRLDLLALPEYQEKDIRVSAQLADRFSEFIEFANEVYNAHINHCQLQVTDGYVTEDKPHYQLKINYGDNGSDLPETTKLSANYSATAEGESFNGSIEISVRSPDLSPYVCRFLEECAFKSYNDLMTEIYPEWETTYDPASPQFENPSQNIDTK